MSAELRELSNALATATERAAASAVAVHTEARGSSSGVVWRPGVIVTSEHALQRDEGIHVTPPDGRAVAATLAGRDPSTDLAVLKCAEATTAISQIAPADSFRAGSLTLVIGRTRASGPVAAMGVISLLAPERRTWRGASLKPYIRLDVELQPTAVGGAIVDAQSRLIGIATARFGRFGVVAIPAALVGRVMDTLLAKGRIPRGYLGVGLQPVRLPDALRESLGRAEKTAAMVLEVELGGPAQKAGVVLGDILVSLEGQPVSHLEDVQAHLHSDAIGKPLAAKIVRGGAAQELKIIVGERGHEEK